MFSLAAVGVTLGLIAVAMAAAAWLRLQKDLVEVERQRTAKSQSFEAALQEASIVAGQSKQRIEALEVSGAAQELAVQRSREMAELSAKASLESAEAARLSATGAAQTVAEALSCARTAEGAAQTALRAAVAAEGATQSALRAVVAAEGVAQSALRAVAAAEGAAQSALRATSAAEEVAQSNRALAEIGKRAWVHAAEFRVSLKPQGNENSTLEVRIANLGSTPARELKVTTNFHVEDAVPGELPLKPRVSNIVLGPGVSFSISHFLRLSPADLAAIGTGRRLLLASGQAEYVDVFGVARVTRWCAIYNYSGNSFAPAAKHNSTT